MGNGLIVVEHTSFSCLERGGSSRLRRGGETHSSAARPDVGTSLCPAFPSLKYYSVRVERGESPRSPGESPRLPIIALRVDITLATPSSASHARSRSPRGCFFGKI